MTYCDACGAKIGPDDLRLVTPEAGIGGVDLVECVLHFPLEEAYGMVEEIFGLPYDSLANGESKVASMLREIATEHMLTAI